MGKKYIVYGASWCNYCNRAVSLLESKGFEHYFFDAGDDRTFLMDIKKFYDSPTVPVVVCIDNSSGLTSKVGGCSDLERVLSSDEQ